MTSIKSKYLDRLLEDFRLLSETVLLQISDARKLLSAQNNDSTGELYEEVEKNEIIIDGLDIKVREEVINAIFLFTPRAADLRKVIAYHDMTIYLERVGDLILNVVHSGKRMDLKLPGFEEFEELLSTMLKHSDTMVKNAVIAFSCEDNSMAYATISTDDKVDDLFKQISIKLAESFKERPLSEQELTNIMSINSISYNIERIADNATNIAESAIYLTEGKDIRHQY
ncbi:MAG: hypothetical protein FWF54_01760 [Candidatus Azobacteroides sp.]|nr:hypothetical protein [Candidatus Azobacteroides sp.]